MTRIEKQANVEERLQEVKDEMSRELKRARKGRNPFLTCGGIFLLVVVGALVWSVWTVAATGLVSVPMFSRLAYAQPEPIRVVQPGVPVEVVVEQQIDSIFAPRLQQGNGSLETSDARVTLSETSLTASLRNVAEQAGWKSIDSSRVQVAIEEGKGFQLFVPFVDRGGVVAWVGLDVDNGLVKIRLDEVRVGNARVPGWLVNSVVGPFVDREMRTVQASLTRYVTVEAIEVSQGNVAIDGQLSIHIIEGDL